MPRKVLARYLVATANFATAGWRTFGPIRRRRIRRMILAVLAEEPDFGSLSEAAWRRDVHDYIIEVAREKHGNRYGFTQRAGTSVMSFWDRREVVVESRRGRRAHGPVIAGGHLVSDARVDLVLVYFLKRARRRLKDVAVHWSPIRPALGAEAVRDGLAAQENAIDGLKPVLSQGPVLKVCQGDPNNHTRFLGTSLNGRDVDYAGDTIPDRIICVDGGRTRGELSSVRYPTLPGGDHYRGRTKTGRKRPVFLVATLTIQEEA